MCATHLKSNIEVHIDAFIFNDKTDFEHQPPTHTHTLHTKHTHTHTHTKTPTLLAKSDFQKDVLLLVSLSLTHACPQLLY